MSMKASTALLELFKDEREWRQLFRSCCEMSTRRLMAKACRFGDELKERDYPCPAEEVEDALLGLVRDLLPESVAAGWDAEWAHALCKGASPAWQSTTLGSPPRRRTPLTYLVKTYGTSGW